MGPDSSQVQVTESVLPASTAEHGAAVVVDAVVEYFLRPVEADDPSKKNNAKELCSSKDFRMVRFEREPVVNGQYS
ncbi:hypothetical protein ACA910_010337 [Epithemia clementina (nom. ined.)]